MNFSSTKPRVWVEISSNAIISNLQIVRKQVSPLKIMAVLKANAYGLGIKKIANILQKEGIDVIGVAELQEALEIIKLGIETQVLGGIIPDEIPPIVANNIIAPISDLQTALLINEEAKSQGKKHPCHILLDTGMGRLGMICKKAEKVIKKISTLPNLNLTGIYSHFPSANYDPVFSKLQINNFLELLNKLKKQNIIFQKRHIANSDGINNISTATKAPFNMVRTGINLYGVHDLQGSHSVYLKPALTLKTRLVSVRTLPAKSTIGYGRTYSLHKKTKVGTISIGYADGFPIALSNRGYVIIREKICPVLGCVSMDYVTVSLENCPDATPGDEVICIGTQNNNTITVEDYAQLKGVNPYEIICSLGNRVKREYL